MKTKGISVWEQHIEYIVLAIAVLVFGYFAWTTFSNQASVKNNNKVITTENVDDELIASANILSPKLDDSAPSPVEIVAPKELLSTFEEGITASLSPNARVVFPGVDLTSGFLSTKILLLNFVLIYNQQFRLQNTFEHINGLQRLIRLK